MDQRIAWPQPEQLGPSCQQWSHIWSAFRISENTLTSAYNHFSARSPSNGTCHQCCSEILNRERISPVSVTESCQPVITNVSKPNVSSTTSNDHQKRCPRSTPVSKDGNSELVSSDDQRSKQTGETTRRNSDQENTRSDDVSRTQNTESLEGSENVPWVRPAGYNSSVPELGLHDEIVDFYAYVSPTEEERCMRQQVASRIGTVIKTVWPTVRVEVFGSFKTGLYLPTSDIDMVVIGVGVWDKKPPLRELERVLLERHIAEPHNIKVLDNASVPIVRVTDQESSIRVDISFSTSDLPSCLRSAELIRGFIQRYEPLRYLVLVLKQFLLERGLNETWTGGVGSYSLILMVVHFLQNHERGESAKNYGALLVEFFEMFGERFNYQQLVLRINHDSNFQSPLQLPSDKAYLKKEEFTRAVQREEPSYCPSMLTIEDPLVPLRDIARGSYGALYARKAFQHALHALREPMLGVAHSLLIRNHLGNVPTYLGRIVRLTHEVCEYREQIRRKYRPLLLSARECVAAQQAQVQAQFAAQVRSVPAPAVSRAAFVDAAGFVRIASTAAAWNAANGVRLASALNGINSLSLSSPNGILLANGAGNAAAAAAFRNPFATVRDLGPNCAPQLLQQIIYPNGITTPIPIPIPTQMQSIHAIDGSSPTAMSNIKKRSQLRGRGAELSNGPRTRTRASYSGPLDSNGQSAEIGSHLQQYANTRVSSVQSQSTASSYCSSRVNSLRKETSSGGKSSVEAPIRGETVIRSESNRTGSSFSNINAFSSSSSASTDSGANENDDADAFEDFYEYYPCRSNVSGDEDEGEMDEEDAIRSGRIATIELRQDEIDGLSAMNGYSRLASHHASLPGNAYSTSSLANSQKNAYSATQLQTHARRRFEMESRSVSLPDAQPQPARAHEGPTAPQKTFVESAPNRNGNEYDVDAEDENGVNEEYGCAYTQHAESVQNRINVPGNRNNH